MTVNFSNAVAAYNKAVSKDGVAGLDARDSSPGTDFASVLREAAESAIGTLEKGESQTLSAAADKASINDVVVAMSQAEMTLQTVVTLRDRVIQAYQEIMRMPV